MVTVGSLAPGQVLTPSRYGAPAENLDGPTLGELVVAARDSIRPARAADAERLVVLDTTHARNGVVDVDQAEAAGQRLGSVKRRVQAGDVLISRLRPYLRQVALVDDDAVRGRTLCCSTEFYVLRARDGESIAYLVAWLLSPAVQAALDDAQEGGHHPRVNEDTLLRLVVPRPVYEQRAELSAAVVTAAASYRDSRRWFDVADQAIAVAVAAVVDSD